MIDGGRKSTAAVDFLPPLFLPHLQSFHLQSISNHIQLYTTIPHTITSHLIPHLLFYISLSSFNHIQLSFHLELHTIIPHTITESHYIPYHPSVFILSLSLSSLLTHWGTIIYNHIQSYPHIIPHFLFSLSISLSLSIYLFLNYIQSYTI